MSSRSLNQLIASVISGAEEAEAAEETSATVAQVETRPRTSEVSNDVEKLASVLEFLGQRGIENLLVKEAMEKCGACGKKCAAGMAKCASCGAPMVKKAGAAPQTNESANLKGTSGKQVTSTKASPPMKSKGSGPVENTMSKKPMAGSANTSSTEHGTHHPALASNESAIKASPTMKEQRVAPALKKVLSNAGGDSNHQKMKKANEHNLDEIRAELARRVAVGGA